MGEQRLQTPESKASRNIAARKMRISNAFGKLNRFSIEGY
jgi:hypothetical protein